MVERETIDGNGDHVGDGRHVPDDQKARSRGVAAVWLTAGIDGVFRLHFSHGGLPVGSARTGRGRSPGRFAVFRGGRRWRASKGDRTAKGVQEAMNTNLLVLVAIFVCVLLIVLKLLGAF